MKILVTHMTTIRKKSREEADVTGDIYLNTLYLPIFFAYPIICYVEFDWFGKSIRVHSLCRAYTGLLV